MYASVSLWMRYFFAVLAIAFVIRAWIITVRDNRRARTIRSWLPETGTIGEWMVLEGSSHIRKGTKLPILNEGMIGSSRRADIRIPHADVLREHAYFEQAEDGLIIRPAPNAPVLVESQLGGVFHPADGHVNIKDGDVLILGKFRMVLTMFAENGGRTIIIRQTVPAEDEKDTLDAQLDALPVAKQVKKEPFPELHSEPKAKKSAPKIQKSPSAKKEVKPELPWQDEENPIRKR